MKRGRQRRSEIQARRRKGEKKRAASAKAETPKRFSAPVPVNTAALAPHNSYGVPAFLERRYYTDVPFRCVGCGLEEVWTGAQQKWWYKVVKGFVYSTAIRGRACRPKEREPSATARGVHLEGRAGKKAAARKETEQS